MATSLILPPSAKHRLLQALKPYQHRFDTDLMRYKEVLGEPGRLRDASEYALTGAGKRVRPALVYMVADGLGHNLDVAAAAIAIECAHCASLIADDLPMMDDDEFRRGRPTCHRAFDEATAVLASYTLISSGFELVVANSDVMSRGPQPFAAQSGRACQIAVKCVAYQTGGWGLTIGQYKDLFEPAEDEEGLLEIYRQKTSCLFQAAMELGWVFGGGDLKNLAQVREAGVHLGNLFQMVNDCKDAHLNIARTPCFNGMSVVGKEGILELAETLTTAAQAAVKRLGLKCNQLEALTECLHEVVLEYLTSV